MDVRISFRVRERKDTDLILGQGMLAAGWQAHTLNAPGKFLISAPEYDSPRRARAYLLADEAVARAATMYAAMRPLLDDVSMRALERRAQLHPDASAGRAVPGYEGSFGGSPDDDTVTPGAMLWLGLSTAPAGGASIADLMSSSGMNRTTLYRHLIDHSRAGRAIQVSRGRWRAVGAEGSDAVP